VYFPLWACGLDLAAFPLFILINKNWLSSSLLLQMSRVLSVMALSSPLSLFVASVAQEKMVLESETKVNQIHHKPVGLCACTFGSISGSFAREYTTEL